MSCVANCLSFGKVQGWILDVYPSGIGEVTVWLVTKEGRRVWFVDRFEPRVYVWGAAQDIEQLAKDFFGNSLISDFRFVYKFVDVRDNEKSRVLEFKLKDTRWVFDFVKCILEKGDFLRYKVYNCEVFGDREYLFMRDLFPLAFVEVKIENKKVKYTVLDSVEQTNYVIPELSVVELDVKVLKGGKLACFTDSIGEILVFRGKEKWVLKGMEEKEALLRLVELIRWLDPDIILTRGGDSFVFPYFIHRAVVNRCVSEFILSRDKILSKTGSVGKSFFSYGRTYYKAGAVRLYGRIHVDANNTFVLSEAGFDGLFEIARTCRVLLHDAARNSIGSSMSSLQFYQAIKDDVLIPRNKSVPEFFKSAYELMVGDRGGFVFEPKVGLHECVGEVDFSSMYPVLMVKNNISAETVLCRCCLDSPLRIPELNYHICNKRKGIVPKTLELVVNKRLYYKRLKNQTRDDYLKHIFDRRQIALKWILVTCFGYLGYHNAKFGTVEGHMGVCAFGRKALLKAVDVSESLGFEVVHGIVDSLWLKKEKATFEEYNRLCDKISKCVEVPINFEGCYRWIVFLPSKMHPRLGVMNRYFGVLEDGKIKVRGLDLRRRDTPGFVLKAQKDMLDVLGFANDRLEVYCKIPRVLDVVREYRRKLLDGNVSLSDLIVTKNLSKNPRLYKQQVSQLIAARQLMEEGGEINAGSNIRFLFTDVKGKRPERRVRAAHLIEKNTSPDVVQYLRLLYSSAADLLCFAGYDVKKVNEEVLEQKQKRLDEYIIM